MALQEEIKKIIEDKESIVAVSAVGKSGNPYTEISKKLVSREDGRLAYYELLESSQLQKNLVFSLWFNKEISISVIAKDRKNYTITGKPYRAIIAGHEFEEQYVRAQEEFGEKTDLSTVWLIDVTGFWEDTYEAAKQREEEEHPYLMHMDQIYRRD